MNRAQLFSLAALCVSCSDLSDAADDIATIDLGGEQLSPIEIERSVELGAARLPACINVGGTVPGSSTTVALMNSPEGCVLTVAEPDMVLADQQTIDRAREEKGAFDVDGIRGGSIELESLQLTAANGSPLDLADYVAALSVEVDGDVLLDRIEPKSLTADAKLTRKLPDPLVEKLKSALANNQPATAELVLKLWLTDRTLADPPDALSMRVVLQPTLEVNVVDAL
jgi:hypothetical protein